MVWQYYKGFQWKKMVGYNSIWTEQASVVGCCEYSNEACFWQDGKFLVSSEWLLASQKGSAPCSECSDIDQWRLLVTCLETAVSGHLVYLSRCGGRLLLMKVVFKPKGHISYFVPFLRNECSCNRMCDVQLWIFRHLANKNSSQSLKIVDLTLVVKL